MPSRGHAQRMDSMENVDFGVDELADIFVGLDSAEYLSVVVDVTTRVYSVS